MNTLIVVNPHSANSKTAKRWPAIEHRLRPAIGDFDVHMTKGPKDAVGIVSSALEDGITRIIAVGGDGTINEVINGFFKDGKAISPEAILGLIPTGTGGDFRKTLGIGRNLDECIPILANGYSRTIDLGLVSFINHEGVQTKSYFANITSFGIGGLVDQFVNNSTKAFGGKVSFFWGTLRALLSYSNKPIHLRVGDVFDKDITAKNVVVANGQFFGGGMWIAPEAKIDDGMFDIVVLGDLTKLELMGLSKRIYKGTHLEHEKVFSFRASKVEATCSESTLIDMDGEQPGMLPISMEVLAHALKVFAPGASAQSQSNSEH